MKVTLYTSRLCPRCYLARKSLEHYKMTHPDIELECVDILASPRRTFREGIRMIPAIQAGKHRLAGIYLDRKGITAFLDEIRCNSRSGQRTQL